MTAEIVDNSQDERLASSAPEPAGLPAARLDTDELAAYEQVIAAPSLTLPELATTWSRKASLEAVMAALEAKGFVTRQDGPESRYTAVDPEVALDSPLAEYETKLERARTHVQRLTARHRARSITSADATLVEIVTGRRAVLQRLTQLLRAARDEIRCLHKVAYFDDLRTEEELGVLQRGIACRTIYERASVEHPGSLDGVERMLAVGLQARVLPSLSIQLYLADRRYALLPLQLESAGGVEAAVVVHPCALLDALRKLFDGLWDRALPLQRSNTSVARTAGRRVLDEHRLITLLLSGLTDEAIARQRKIGYRTVQRHVAELMANLGAHTRFQAGVQTALMHRNPSPESSKGAQGST